MAEELLSDILKALLRIEESINELKVSKFTQSGKSDSLNESISTPVVAKATVESRGALLLPPGSLKSPPVIAEVKVETYSFIDDSEKLAQIERDRLNREREETLVREAAKAREEEELAKRRALEEKTKGLLQNLLTVDFDLFPEDHKKGDSLFD
jgi:hypothetical protein